MMLIHFTTDPRVSCAGQESSAGNCGRMKRWMKSSVAMKCTWKGNFRNRVDIVIVKLL